MAKVWQLVTYSMNLPNMSCCFTMWPSAKQLCSASSIGLTRGSGKGLNYNAMVQLIGTCSEKLNGLN